MTTLFISDLHLCGTRPAATAAFLEFLRNDAAKADALYILGDLFEFWAGDDDTDEAFLQVQQGLRELTQQNIPCYVMHGNRDFMIGNTFAKNTGTQLLDDPTLVDMYGQKVVLSHGDILCTDDEAYQRYRRIVHWPWLQKFYLWLPLAWRNAVANRIRSSNQSSTAEKPVYIIDVNELAVRDMLTKYNTDILLHGHTHRPAIHAIESGEQPATRIVLGDWYEQGSVLRWSRDDYKLTTIKF
jgi:UDP-2,3-diacylglucosamine hydrolase